MKYDVVIVGYGLSGALTAYWCNKLGLSCCVLEKKSYAGGVSMCAGGDVRCSSDADKTFQYLKKTNKDTCPEELLKELAEGMTDIYDDLKMIANEVGAETSYVKTTDTKMAQHHYGFEGWDSLDIANVQKIDCVNLEKDYPNAVVRSHATGWKLYATVDQAVRKRKVPIFFDTPLETVDRENRLVNGKFEYNRLVIATGGFESDPELQKQHWQIGPIMHNGFDGNTGDAIKMLSSWGADNWHMWHYHGAYCFRHPDGFGIRLKGMSAWNPTQKFEAYSKRPVSHILVDQEGKRFMNEWNCFYTDSSHRPLEYFDNNKVKYTRSPAFFISNEDGKHQGAWGSITANMPKVSHKKWSEDNEEEIKLGIITKCDTLEDLAEYIGCDFHNIKNTLSQWSIQHIRDEFGRPNGPFIDFSHPPYYVAKVWPTVGNTHGGPRHNINHQPINAFGEVVDNNTYVVGECGSLFGWLYMSSGNWSECFVSAKNSAQHIKNSIK